MGLLLAIAYILVDDNNIVSRGVEDTFYYLAWFGFLATIFLAFSVKKTILVLAIIAVLAIASSFFSLFHTVRKTCDLAKEKYQGKCQTALISVLEDEKATSKEKNDAIWALGQMAEPESLPALERIYAGKVPEGREPLNEVVSQYEIEKAIRWCKKGNSTSWMYRGLRN
jgi:hypothetical protein